MEIVKIDVEATEYETLCIEDAETHTGFSRQHLNNFCRAGRLRKIRKRIRIRGKYRSIFYPLEDLDNIARGTFVTHDSTEMQEAV